MVQSISLPDVRLFASHMLSFSYDHEHSVGAGVGSDDTDVQMRIWSMSATEVALCSLILITSPKEYGTTVVTRFAAV